MVSRRTRTLERTIITIEKNILDAHIILQQQVLELLHFISHILDRLDELEKKQ